MFANVMPIALCPGAGAINCHPQISSSKAETPRMQELSIWKNG
jgi:hypothetical protein